MVAAGLVLAMVVTGCETTGQSAGLGAIIGAAAGALVGDETGALIGAAVGAAAGAIIGRERQRRLASKADVEQEYAPVHGHTPTEPFVSVEDLDVTPQRASPGQSLELKTNYQLIGPPAASVPQGAFQLKREGELLANIPIEEVQSGRSEVTRAITIPESMQPGEYEVEVTIMNGNSVSTVKRSLYVA